VPQWRVLTIQYQYPDGTLWHSYYYAVVIGEDYSHYPFIEEGDPHQQLRVEEVTAFTNKGLVLKIL